MTTHPALQPSAPQTMGMEGQTCEEAAATDALLPMESSETEKWPKPPAASASPARMPHAISRQALDAQFVVQDLQNALAVKAPDL